MGKYSRVISQIKRMLDKSITEVTVLRRAFCRGILLPAMTVCVARYVEWKGIPNTDCRWI